MAKNVTLPNGTTALQILGTGAITSNGKPAGLMVISDIGPITQSRNRLQAAVSLTNVPATNSFTWTAAQNIREITVTVTGAGAPIMVEDYVSFCFNAGSDAIAAAWLPTTEVSSIADDVQNEKVLVGESKTFRFTSPLTRLDALAVTGSAAMTSAHVHIGAH